MAVTINGTTGIQNPLGSAAAPSESNTTNSNTGAYFPTGTTYGIATNGSNAMYIDASQNVGIGTSSPQAHLDVSGSGTQYARVSSSTNASFRGFEFAQTGSAISYGSLAMELALGEVRLTAGYSTYGGFQTFYTNGSERMRIDSSGNLLVGQFTSSFGGKICTAFTSASQVAATFTDTVTSGYTGSYVVFLNSSSAVAGYISHPSATTVGYVASSDYRLKKDVAPLSGSLDRVMKLKPVSYTWTEDNVYGEGFIAHELQEVIPLAAYGIKDAVNEDGSIKPQGVDYGKLTTVLVAAMQEQQKLIQELSAEVTALKAKVGA